MAKNKYLSLQEAAEQVQMQPEELLKLRDAGEIRAFSDRGNWKFLAQHIEDLRRSRQVDSDPEVEIFDPIDETRSANDQTQAMDLRPSTDAGGGTEPMMDLEAAFDDADADDDDSVLSGLSALDAAAATAAGSAAADASGSNVLDEDDVLAEQGTVVRGGTEDFSTSDSDVRLIVDDSISIAAGDSALPGGTAGSDSDVSLVPDSDSDVRLLDAGAAGVASLAGAAGLAGAAAKLTGDQSDSDVQLVEDDADSLNVSSQSDSEVRIADDVNLMDSDSDVRIADDPNTMDSDDEVVIAEAGSMESDPEVVLAADSDDAIAASQTGVLDGTDSDVRLLVDDDESGIALEFEEDGAGEQSVLTDDASAISLDASGVLDAGESGISLELPSDSGVSLDVGDEGLALAEPEDADSGIALDLDSGIALEAADSGIALESIGDSGIALDAGSGISLADSGSALGGTLPMMDAAFDDSIAEGDQTQQFAIADGESDFDMADSIGDSAEFDDATQELDSVDIDALDDSVNDSNFDLDGGDLAGDLSGDFDAELTGSFDDMEIDEFDDEMVVAGDDEFDDMQSGIQGGGFAPVGVGSARVEREWGIGEVVPLALSALVMLPLAALMIDLMSTMWGYEAGVEPVAGPILGLFKS